LLRSFAPSIPDAPLSSLLRLKRSFAMWLLLGAALAAGCAGAPVQEMSNARQAVRAAERAGAQQHAPQLMGEAKQALRAAETHLKKGEYGTAREEAEQARAKAVEARQVAEAATKPPPTP
jgi:hypothetical protein